MVLALSGVDPVTITYSYDPLYRLTAADYADGSYFHYSYDPVGNRLTEESAGGVVVTYTYDIANRLTTVNDVPLTWDDNGKLLQDHSGTVYTLSLIHI